MLGRIVSQLAQAVHGLCPQRRGIARNGLFACLFDAWEALIERDDELSELSREVSSTHRHGFELRRAAVRRAAFHTSPHPAHRQ